MIPPRSRSEGENLGYIDGIPRDRHPRLDSGSESVTEAKFQFSSKMNLCQYLCVIWIVPPLKRRRPASNQMTYYEILGVPKEADATQIKKAFRKLAMQYHPDVSKEPEAETRFKLIYIAYDILTDPYKRTLYDEMQERRQREPVYEERKMNDWQAGVAHTARHYSRMRYEEFDDSLLSKIRFHTHQGIALIFAFSLLCISFVCIGLGYWFLTGKHYNGSILLGSFAFIAGAILMYNAFRALIGVFKIWTMQTID